MNYLTKKKFLEKVNLLKLANPEHWGNEEGETGRPKSTDRWDYHKKAVEILKTLNPKSVLEAGSMGILLTSISDTIDFDLPDDGWRLTYKPTYNYDLTGIPWKPIKDKQYDVFVALRVFHHMKSEKSFFKEMARISNNVILALTPESAYRYEHFLKADLLFYFGNTNTVLLVYKNL